MKTMIILAFSLFVSSNLLAADEAPKNCQIDVKYFYKTGADEVKTYHLIAKSKSDCEKKSKLYKENTTPKGVDKKEVEVKWRG